MIFVGIDPGLEGAVAAVDGAGTLSFLADTPVVRSGKTRCYDEVAMADMIRSFGANVAMVVLEQAQAMPGQGVSSTFRTGEGFGIWRGILGALALRRSCVGPLQWQRELYSGCRLAGDPKAKSIARAMQLFPRIELVPPGCRVPRDGRADAACMAYYALRMAGRQP